MTRNSIPPNNEVHLCVSNKRSNKGRGLGGGCRARVEIKEEESRVELKVETPT